MSLAWLPGVKSSSREGWDPRLAVSTRTDTPLVTGSVSFWKVSKGLMPPRRIVRSKNSPSPLGSRAPRSTGCSRRAGGRGRARSLPCAWRRRRRRGGRGRRRRRVRPRDGTSRSSISLSAPYGHHVRAAMLLAAILTVPKHVGYPLLFLLVGMEASGIPVPGETALIGAAL